MSHHHMRTPIIFEQEALAGVTVVKPGIDARIVARTATGAISVTLPAIPGRDQVVEFEDADGQASINPVSISGNGNTIEGQTDWTVDQNGASLTFVWVKQISDWRIV